MFEYFRRHWVITFLIGIVWGVTIWHVNTKPKKVIIENVQNDTVTVARLDTTRAKVDSIMEDVEMKKKMANLKLYELKKQKEELEQKAKQEKAKRIAKEKEIEIEKKKKKEVIKEKKVFVKDPDLEKKVNDYEKENSKLKEELEKTCKANEALKEEKFKLERAYTEEMIPDTVVKKKKKKFGLF